MIYKLTLLLTCPNILLSIVELSALQCLHRNEENCYLTTLLLEDVRILLCLQSQVDVAFMFLLTMMPIAFSQCEWEHFY